MSDLIWIVFLYVIPLAVLWAALIIDLVRRDDIGIGRKTLWAALTLITAEFGAVVYIAFRPLRFPEDGVAPGVENPMADRLLLAAESRDSGELEELKVAALEKLRIG